MKKTLIALAVAASAAVSGSAMAWTANGTGGSVDLGGTLTPTDVITPWEVKVGAAVNGLDADIRKGDTKVDIPVKKAIPVLGIRTIESAAFTGQPGISPQIEFNGVVSELDNLADANDAVLTLDVTDGVNKIGKMVAPFIAAAQYSVAGPSANSVYKSMYAAAPVNAFMGGLATVKGSIQEAFSDRVAALDSEFKAHFNEQGISRIESVSGPNSFANTQHTYSAWYGSGIESGKSIKISLNTPAGADEIVWKASLPVTVSYQ
ncbi:hypothetical protein KF979_004136 [Escherichia coli]|nr:hypothetical protein [Escherichia coli]EHM2965380.1 hypothetical protein [Escherichia coli]EHM3193771.1 hypothetical protein [Escherichia coli]